jgi:cyclo(L-tyrosyl-L-tyrosyl) synthase
LHKTDTPEAVSANAIHEGYDELFVAQPLTTACAELLHRRDRICLGISPFNSYFKRERIAQMCVWAAHRFPGVDFHLPDGPSAFTLQALGMPQEKATKRAHENGLKMHNRIAFGQRTAGLTDDRGQVLDWARLSSDPVFQQLHRTASDLFARSRVFRALCKDASRTVLRNRLGVTTEPSETQIDQAVQYFLADIPLLLDTAAITGHAASLYAYHRATPFIQALYGGELPLRPSPGQGYLVLCPSDSTT